MYKFKQPISEDIRLEFVIPDCANYSKENKIYRNYSGEENKIDIGNTNDNISNRIVSNEYYKIYKKNSNIIDDTIQSYNFPEFDGAEHIVGTNDGILVFQFSDYMIVYDLLYGTEKKDLLDVPKDIRYDIRSYISLIENRMYNSEHVHVLDIEAGAIVPKIICNGPLNSGESLSTHRYFVDMYPSESAEAYLDEYGYYKHDGDLDSFTKATFLKTGPVIVSNTSFSIIKSDTESINSESINNDKYFYGIIPKENNSDFVSIQFSESYYGKAIVCI